MNPSTQGDYMQMQQVNSTSIAQIGYNRRTMNVIFQGGKSYVFKKVPRRVFDEFRKSSSLGSFFNTEIKENYPHTAVA